MVFKSKEYKITLIAEFKPVVQSENIISKLSDKISKMIRRFDYIITDLQSVPSGYRITYTIYYKTNFFRRDKYTKELAKLSDFFGNDKSNNNCLSRYYYTRV